ncbi:sigma-70 family RNA polymerase sigma factor [Streptomyces sp. 549]|uniref:sigma-70 family RNA polymerase sigma factor n=1 Tax=Streptomyces sp. 549 TaxID=3049076 RepID=UPI0024C2DDAE|nr:sigma-70 family RNA polymerase sigma factor [Streptomyces sp. 549]MDK1474600.1 sigma-70 family RNA polymerase sigma factor [Streptomyces sp. 549]
MSREREASTIAAAQAGDQRARDELVAAYLPLVYNIAGRALHGHADVDDVVQETMLRALAGLASLREPDSFRSWLVAITMNQIRRHWQKHAAQPHSSLHDTHDVADPGADFVDLTIVRLGLSGQRREVAEATRWLESEDRALLSLWWLEAAGELTREEVSRAVELPPQHTAVRIQRMKARLETSRAVVRALTAVPRCAELDRELAAWDGAPSALWRKRLARHSRECADCARHGGGLVPAEGLLVGIALVPPGAGLLASLSVPPETVATAAVSPAGAADTRADGSADGPVEGSAGGAADGGTTLRGRHGKAHRGRRRRRVVVAVAAAATVVTAIGAGRMLLDRSEDSTSVKPAAAPSPEPSDTTEPSPSAPPKSASPSASPSPSPSAPTKAAEPKAASSSSSARPSPPQAAPEPPPAPKTEGRSAAPAPAAPPQAGPGGTAQQVIAILNRERAKNGCGAVRSNNLLASAALKHSQDMAARDYFSHTAPDGSGPGERITAAGYRWSTYGENIARGQQTPAQVMQSWMDSPGHRANILNCAFKEVGIGVHQGSGGPWWTQKFGAQ